MIVLARFSCSPRGCSRRDMATGSPVLAVSGLGHLFKNLHSNGIAAEPGKQMKTEFVLS